MPTSLNGRMGRPPTYTPEMDEVILSFRKVHDVLRVFAERGWEDRSPRSIIQRRQYLKRQGLATDYEAESLAQRYTRLLARRRVLEKELARLTEETDQVRAQMDNISEQIAEVLEEMAAEVDAEG